MADFGFEFWQRVDNLLGNRKLTDLAAATGMNYQTLRNQRSELRYPKKDAMDRISEYLGTTPDFLKYGSGIVNRTKQLCEEAQFVQDNPEARALVRAIMDDPSLLYPLSALVGRLAPAAATKEEA